MLLCDIALSKDIHVTALAESKYQRRKWVKKTCTWNTPSTFASAGRVSEYPDWKINSVYFFFWKIPVNWKATWKKTFVTGGSSTLLFFFLSWVGNSEAMVRLLKKNIQRLLKLKKLHTFINFLWRLLSVRAGELCLWLTSGKWRVTADWLPANDNTHLK